MFRFCCKKFYDTFCGAVQYFFCHVPIYQCVGHTARYVKTACEKLCADRINLELPVIGGDAKAQVIDHEVIIPVAGAVSDNPELI